MSEATSFSVDPSEFRGQRALVTGGTKGMGESIVRRLVAGGRDGGDDGTLTVAGTSDRGCFVQADISTRKAWTA